MMRAFPAIRIPTFGYLQKEAFPITRTRICFPRQLHCYQSESAESLVDGSLNFRTVPPSLFAAEKEEAKAVLTMFLEKQGLSSSFAAKTSNTSDQFIEHLVTRLHAVYKTPYQLGRELSTLEIRDTLIPYFESLLKEHGDILTDVIEKFPDPPEKEAPRVVSAVSSSSSSKKLKAMARVSEIDSDGKLPPNVLYLLDLGMDIDQIKSMIRRFPAFAYYSLERKIKPLVEFLLELGVNRSDIPSILSRRPQLCGISLSENLIPTMTYLESLGVDNEKWAKVIYRFPALLTYSRHKLNTTVDYLYELGLTAENVGKTLTRFPHIISFSVKDNLRPKVEYFRLIGVDVAVLVNQTPQVFGFSNLGNMKQLTEFFLQKGFSVDEVGAMASRFGVLYTLSLEEIIIPKWEFFLTMDYPTSDLVKFPQYFGYSLEDRIKPRHAQMMGSGVKMLLTQLLSSKEPEFNKFLKLRMKKKLLDGLDMMDDENLPPTAEYLSSMGIDVAILVQRAPQVFGLSIEQNLKPITEFFLEVGFSKEEITTMVSRKGSLYGFSLVKNIIPKWEFFLTMDYSKSELVKFPHYFGYSLEERIKPRYAQMRESGLKLSFHSFLTVAELEFEKFLNKRMRMKLDDLHCSNMKELMLNYVYFLMCTHLMVM